MAATVPVIPPTYFESAGKLPPFTSFATDLNLPGHLERAAKEISYRNEIILVCGDGSAYASPTALNTVLQFYALRLRHVLYVSDGPDACQRLQRAVPTLACAWSSVINTSKPTHDSVLVKKWWDMRFYFYNVRKHMLSRLAGELGYNVIQTDTDVAWFANPYPALKAGVLAAHQLVVQPDLPLANAGVLYAQRIGAADPAAWVLRETVARIHTFSFHPDAVPSVVSWAQPPYFSNADEQSILNDVLASAITRRPCYIFSTAIMEMKYGGIKKHNRSFRWENTPESRTKASLMKMVRERTQRLAFEAPSCGDPRGLRLCQWSPRGSRANVSVLASHLNSWNLSMPPPELRPAAMAPHTPGGAPLSRYAKAPNWLFQHYTHFDPRDAHRPHSRASIDAAAAADAREPTPPYTLEEEPRPFGTFSGLPAVYMVHLAALRQGAWQRRAVLRAHGWWHPRADRLAATELHWGARRGWLILSPSNVLRAAGRAERAITPASEAQTLVGNFVLLAALLGRVPVVPELPCEQVEAAVGNNWKETRRRRGERRCAWVPPRACWQLEYATTLELQRVASQNDTLARLFRSLQNRSRGGAGLRAQRALWRAARRTGEALACGVESNGTGGLPGLLTLAPRGGASASGGRVAGGGGAGRGGGGGSGGRNTPFRSGAKSAAKLARAASLVGATPGVSYLDEQGRRLAVSGGAGAVGTSAAIGAVAREDRALERLRALPCDKSEIVAIDDHVTEERLRRRKLQPAASLVTAESRTRAAHHVAAKASGRAAKAAANALVAAAANAVGGAWMEVDAARLEAALVAMGKSPISHPSQQRDPRVGWLLRDAACIDELLKWNEPSSKTVE